MTLHPLKKRSPCLEASHAVVHVERCVMGVVFCQWVDCDIIVWKTNTTIRQGLEKLVWGVVFCQQKDCDIIVWKTNTAIR
jgi:hypothetical protein